MAVAPSTAVLDAVVLVVAAGYAWGVRRLARRGRRWPAWSSASFAAGLAAILAAVTGPVAAVDDTNVSAHAVQHLLLMMTAPPLLCLGRPALLASQAGRRGLQRAVNRMVNARAIRWLTSPAAWVAYYCAMYAAMSQPWYGVEVRDELLHDTTHIVILVLGLLVWEPLAGARSRGGRVTLPSRVVPFLLGMPAESLVGFLLMFRARPLPGATLAGTHAGGQVFWMGAMVLSSVAMAVGVGQWIVAEQRRDLGDGGLVLAGRTARRMLVPGEGHRQEECWHREGEVPVAPGDPDPAEERADSQRHR